MIHSYSDLIKLTSDNGLTCMVDPKIIVGLEELEEVKEGKEIKVPKRTRIDILDGSKVIRGAYIVKQAAVHINTQMENVIARNNMRDKRGKNDRGNCTK